VDAFECASEDDEYERPPSLPRISEEQRRERLRKQIGISSVPKEKLWLERQSSNQWGKGVKGRHK